MRKDFGVEDPWEYSLGSQAEEIPQQRDAEVHRNARAMICDVDEVLEKLKCSS